MAWGARAVRVTGAPEVCHHGAREHEENVDGTKLKGSASSYDSEDIHSDKFFVHFFTRDCAAIADLTDVACTTITTDLIPLAGDDKAPGDRDLNGYFSMAVRAYVSPESEYGRGPDPRLQQRPYALTFHYE